MSSREIAELTGKRHSDVCRDVRVMLEQVNIDERKFASVYMDAKNEARTEYRLPKDLTITLVSGYRADLRLKIVRRWMELESQEVNAMLPKDYPSALRTLADTVEKKELAEKEATEQAEIAPCNG